MNSKNDENTQEKRAMNPHQRAMIKEFQAKVKMENAELCAERSARRYKAERDPVEYEAQKVKQRAEYAAQAKAEGREVRSYEKIKAQTKVEKKTKVKTRHAEKEKERHAKLSPEEKQAISDRSGENRFKRQKSKAGWSEAEIQAGLVIFIEKREAKRKAANKAAAEKAALEVLPDFGVF
jgi:hypothetical protein